MKNKLYWFFYGNLINFSALSASAVYAEISLYQQKNTEIYATVNGTLGMFHSNKGYIPETENQKYNWQEGYVQYGLGINKKIANEGTVYAKTSLVTAVTLGDGDAGGYTDGSESATKIEDAYIGWKSGNIFPILGEDGLDISYGRQNLCLGDGFLICADAPNLGNAPAFPKQYHHDGGGTYYLAGHRNFKDTAILKLAKNKPISLSLFTFKSNNPIQMYARFTGTNLNYQYNKHHLEFTYLQNNSLDHYLATPETLGTNAFREKMKVYSLHGTSNLNLQNALFSFEYAYQNKKNSDTANAWYIKTGYIFSNLKWEPSIFVRYSRFSENWDNLFVGAAEYGTWFQGEVAYNYSGPFNNNTQISTVGLNFSPKENLSFGAIFYKFDTLNKVDAPNLSGKELDIYGVWNINEKLMLSPVLAFYKPEDDDTNNGLQNGNHKLNFYYSIILSYSF
ncbi:hypothetical protein F4V57_09850 [Acinetobacter qingfengensis]|uniref:Uncharacterized protein n=1 Tax=Acinetobacter qingfengensis TaxID=1262585 RepID=A0A1E7RDA3_9GAMM|nr:hypothetical protein [Acinetobacter qingfengensis]KAA8732365.1 hypothetical protein F4V57_09850 [Acinetobacter qingfengensis]OEY97273.1 hypothetical protein BJI46_02315 [Acinetobacter qingfengensis]